MVLTWSDSLIHILKTPRKSYAGRHAGEAVQYKELPAVRMRLTAPEVDEKLRSAAYAQAATVISRQRESISSNPCLIWRKARQF